MKGLRNEYEAAEIDRRYDLGLRWPMGDSRRDKYGWRWEKWHQYYPETGATFIVRTKEKEM
jgi:hypothetical protein